MEDAVSACMACFYLFYILNSLFRAMQLLTDLTGVSDALTTKKKVVRTDERSD